MRFNLIENSFFLETHLQLVAFLSRASTCISFLGVSKAIELQQQYGMIKLLNYRRQTRRNTEGSFSSISGIFENTTLEKKEG